MTGQVYISGFSLNIGWNDPRSSLHEWVFETVDNAIGLSDVSLKDLDSVVIASHDLVDGRSLSSMLTATAAGGYFKDEVRVADDGAVALSLADARLRAGSAKSAVVAAWARPSEMMNWDAVNNALFEPLYTRELGMTELAVSALRAQQMLSLGRLSDRNRNHAIRKRTQTSRLAGPVLTALGPGHKAPYPLRASELPKLADICAAVVLTREPTDLRISGIGHSSEPYRITDRNLLEYTALCEATERALSMADLQLGDIDLFEIDALTMIDEAIAAEALGLSGKAGGFSYVSDSLAFNPSGGASSGHCWPAMGLVRFIRAASSLRHQKLGTRHRELHRGMATGATPLGGQCQTTVVLERV